MDKCNNNPLECLLGNIQDLYPKSNRNKIPFIAELAKEKTAIIALTETHLNKDIKDAEMKIENYTAFRVDRENRSHGGTITYLRDNIAPNTQVIL